MFIISDISTQGLKGHEINFKITTFGFPFYLYVCDVVERFIITNK